MESQMYNDLVLEHFSNPRNVGVIDDADGQGIMGSTVSGDMVNIFIKVKEGRIEEIKFQTFGCGAAIATSSMVTQIVKGMTLEEARNVTSEMVAEELGGLPPGKMHCSNLSVDALHSALDDYESSGHD
jgi:nitrogen fixation NifU-like protein